MLHVLTGAELATETRLQITQADEYIQRELVKLRRARKPAGRQLHFRNLITFYRRRGNLRVALVELTVRYPRANY